MKILPSNPARERILNTESVASVEGLKTVKLFYVLIEAGFYKKPDCLREGGADWSGVGGDLGGVWRHKKIGLENLEISFFTSPFVKG